MSIFEVLSFDFGAFITSVPGIMIIIGIVLLFVAMIFLIFDKKNQKEKLELTLELPKTEINKEVVKDQVEEKKEEQTPVVVLSEGDGVKEVPNIPVPETVTFNETPVVSVNEPKVEELEVESLEIENLNDEPAVPVMESSPVMESKPVIEGTPVMEQSPVVERVEPVVEQPTPVVYGGVSPEVKVEPVVEKPREIYGGANPLENTAPIPSNTVKEAYQGSMNVEKPSMEPAVATPSMSVPIENIPTPQPTEVKVEPLLQPETEEVEKLEF